MTTSLDYTPPVTSSFAFPWAVLGVIVVLVAVVGFVIWRRRKSRFQHELADAQQRIFLRVLVPREMHGEEDERRDFRDLIGVFEPLMASLVTLYKTGGIFGRARQPVFTFEVIAKAGEIHFVVSTPPEYQDLLVRQIHGQYPSAQIEATRNFLLFEGNPPAYDAAQVTLKRVHHYPLKTYRTSELDPLNAITNALSKLSDTSAAAVQLVVRPVHTNWQKGSEAALRKLMEGEEIETKNDWSALAKDVAKSVAASTSGKKDEELTKPKYTNQATVEAVQSKLTKQALEVELRSVVVAPTQIEARTYLNTLMSAYGQFGSPDRNLLRMMKRPTKKLIQDFLLRRFSGKGTMILNTEEIASLYHFPTRYVDTPNIAWLSARSLPPPANLPQEGTLLGYSIYRGEEAPIKLQADDRLRHLYMIGKTGVGKTVFFENMIEQDIKAGNGVCYLDPNGDAIEWILRHIPKERAEDVIYFNPADTARPFGLNMLEWKRPEDKDFLVQESISMFYKLFDPNHTGMIGPQFEHWMRNAALTLMSDPEGGTLVDIPRLFVDPEFEQAKLKHVTDPVVRSFWEKQMAQTSAASKSEMLNYFTSKFGRFMTNDTIRNIIGQTVSSFDFREVMDSGKILLVNLSKGLVGDMNAQLLGMIIISKLQVAAFGRQNVPENERRPFFLYVDEFQNFTTDTFATILSEARKYRLSLHITNQYIAQLEEKIRDAVIGNAGTIISFRVGATDAEFLTHEFDNLTIEDMVNVPKQRFYIKTLINNTPTLPFMGRSSEWDAGGNHELAAAITELSRLKFGRDAAQVTNEILRRSRVEELDLGPQTPVDPGLHTQ